MIIGQSWPNLCEKEFHKLLLNGQSDGLQTWWGMYLAMSCSACITGSKVRVQRSNNQ